MKKPPPTKEQKAAFDAHMRKNKHTPPPPPPKKPDGWMDTPPPGCTHIQFSGMVRGAPVTIVAPYATCGDFSSFSSGKVTYGRLRYDEDFVPHEDAKPEDAQQGAAPPKTPKAKAAPRPKVGGEGKCAFIDRLIMEGTRTAEQIAQEAAEKFGSDLRATLNTVKCRPAHIKKAGKVPPPFKK